MTEYNNIIEIIAPRTIRQVQKNYTPYLNIHLRHQKSQVHKLHRMAKHTDDKNDWLAYKNAKATLNKEITKNKTRYINNKLNNSNNRWNTLKEINNTKGISAPRNIIHNNIIYNNLQKYAILQMITTSKL